MARQSDEAAAALAADGDALTVSGRVRQLLGNEAAARALDDRIREAWLGHPRHSVFTNDAKENGGAGFEAKMRSLIDQVSLLLGLPTTRRKAQKFLLKSVILIYPKILMNYMK